MIRRVSTIDSAQRKQKALFLAKEESETMMPSDSSAEELLRGNQRQMKSEAAKKNIEKLTAL
jgi:hypothetical protein